VTSSKLQRYPGLIYPHSTGEKTNLMDRPFAQVQKISQIAK